MTYTVGAACVDLVRQVCVSKEDAPPAEKQLKKCLQKKIKGECNTNEGRAALARRSLGTLCMRGRLDFILKAKAPQVAASVDSDGQLGGQTACTRGRAACWIALYIALEESAFLRSRGDDDAASLEGVVLRVELEAFLGEALEAPWLGPLLQAAEQCRTEPGSIPWPEDPVARLAAQHSLPLWLSSQWVGLLGSEAADKLAAATNAPGAVCLRSNPIKIADRASLAKVLEEEGTQACPPPGAFDVDSRLLWVKSPAKPNIRGSPAWQGGLYEVQDGGSQLVAAAVGLRKGEVGLDYCAGRGGKSLALFGDRVVSHDIDPKVDLTTPRHTRERREKRDAVACRTLTPAPYTREYSNGIRRFPWWQALEELSKRARKAGCRVIEGGLGGDPGANLELTEGKRAREDGGEAVLHLCRTQGTGLGGRGGGAMQSVGEAAHRPPGGGAGVGDMEAARLEAQGLATLRKVVTAARCHGSCLAEDASSGGAGGLADGVLVDAPCSSLGTLRRGPNVRWELREDEVSQFPPLQRAVLATAASMVRVGGILVYATCTINHAENEAIVEEFEATVGDRFEASPLEEAWGKVVAGRVLGGAARAREAYAVQLLPHVHGTDGFYIARWRRRK